MNTLKIRKLKLPLSASDTADLNAGDVVSLTGTIFTARDAAHKRFTDALKNGGPLPVDLTGAAIYYAGPSPAKEGEPIGSCGPTTAARMDGCTPFLMEQGLCRVTIGKGKRSAAVIEAIQKNGGIYFAALGGAGALYQSRVRDAKIAAYPDLGCEAVYELQVENFPAVVGIDGKGRTILQ
jgi:fumarate hydratase subunit beta